MDIKTAEFTLSSPNVGMCPKDNKPEYAFIGRSNVGKSSLINMLSRNKKLPRHRPRQARRCSSTTS